VREREYERTNEGGRERGKKGERKREWERVRV